MLKVSIILGLNDDKRPCLMIAWFLLQEAFDYIGSSRVVYDMEKNVYPYNSKGEPGLSTIHLHHLNVSRGHVIG